MSEYIVYIGEIKVLLQFVMIIVIKNRNIAITNLRYSFYYFQIHIIQLY